MKDLYTYKAIVEKVVDGDTLKLTVDLGFTVYWKSSCRFYGVNTPELKGKDKDKALLAKEYVNTCVPIGTPVMIQSKVLDKYGRPLVDVFYGEEFKNHLNKELIEKGFAIPFMV